MRKLYLRLACCVVALFAPIFTAHAGLMVNVEYIHKLIEQRWDIVVPYNPALQDVKVAANMKYLLTAVDRANEILNGKQTTDYGNDERYATLAAADTVASIDAVDRLIVKEIDPMAPKFFITTIPDTSYFYFRMSARGDFFVDWGDGTVETITRDNTNTETYSHNYDAPGEYKIGMGGTATEYGTESVLRFDDYEEYGCWKWGYCDFSYFTSVEGSLGALFPTIGDGSAPGQQPSFYMTFYDNALSSVPENLFAGLHGTAAPSMFEKTFEGCTDLTEIPSGLFAGVQLTPANNIFKDTFYYCSGLTKIPSGLFAGIQGAPTEYMFAGTFGSCSGLTEIPPDLFAGIQGEPAKNMFGWTFEGCTSLTGPSAKIGDKYLYEIWSGDVGTWCYKRATGLSDYDDIPSDWK